MQGARRFGPCRLASQQSGAPPARRGCSARFLAHEATRVSTRSSTDISLESRLLDIARAWGGGVGGKARREEEGMGRTDSHLEEALEAFFESLFESLSRTLREELGRHRQVVGGDKSHKFDKSPLRLRRCTSERGRKYSATSASMGKVLSTLLTKLARLN